MDAPLAAQLPVIIDSCMKRDIRIPNIMAQFHRIEQDTVPVPFTEGLRQLPFYIQHDIRDITILTQGILRKTPDGLLLVLWHLPRSRIAVVLQIDKMPGPFRTIGVPANIRTDRPAHQGIPVLPEKNLHRRRQLIDGQLRHGAVYKKAPAAAKYYQ